MNLKLSQAQSTFLNCNTRAKLFLGGIGSGKSRILCYNAIIEALKGRKTAIISFSYRNLKDVIGDTLSKCLLEQGYIEGKDFNFNKSDMDFYVYDNPILLRSSDQPDKLRGLNLHSFFLDECRELSNDTLDIMLGRLRLSSDAFWGGCSTTKGKNWFYNLIDKEGLLNVFKSGYESNQYLTVVLQSTFSSPFIPQEYKDDLKKQYTSLFAQQELYGQIVEFNNGLINPTWFKTIDVPMPGRAVRFWDLAVSTKETADYSVGSILSINDLGKISINNVRRYKLQYPELKKEIIRTANDDGTNVVIGIEKAGQMGAIIDDLSREPVLRNHTIKTVSATKDLYTRSLPLISQIELGNVSITKGSWNREFLEECSNFYPDSTEHDDQIASIIGAYELLNQRSSVTLARLK